MEVPKALNLEIETEDTIEEGVKPSLREGFGEILRPKKKTGKGKAKK